MAEPIRRTLRFMTTSAAQWFGHPRGLSTLFFTELWERFSYYGMRALLVLYMTDVATGGLGFETETATIVLGLYTFGVYALALPGGWIADRILGQKKAVLWGGIIIALGHYALAVPTMFTFFLGLFLGRGRHRTAQAERFGGGRRSVRQRRGRAARRRFLDLLLRDQHRRDAGASPMFLAW